MNIPWKLKSGIFRIIDLFGVYFLVDFLQKYVTKRSVKKSQIFNSAWELHLNVINKYGPMRTLFEFGAGQSLAQNLYLSQAIEKQELVDLNCIIDLKLVENSRRFIDKNYYLLCKPINVFEDLEEYGINYTAPADAKSTQLPSNSIDVCVSTDTLEHIPLNEIQEILKEIYRVLTEDGCLSLKIDYSDHYSHTDHNISSLNFLSYSNSEWKKYNHKYHFQNRLRHDDFAKIITDAGFQIVEEKILSKVDSLEGCQIHDEFKKSIKLEVTEGYFCAKKKVT